MTREKMKDSAGDALSRHGQLMSLPQVSDETQRRAMELMELAAKREKCQKRLQDHLTAVFTGHALKVMRNKHNHKKMWEESKWGL